MKVKEKQATACADRFVSWTGRMCTLTNELNRAKNNSPIA